MCFLTVLLTGEKPMSEDPELVRVLKMPFAFTLKQQVVALHRVSCRPPAQRSLLLLTPLPSLVSTAAELRCSVTPSCGRGIAGRTASVHPELTSDSSFAKIISFDFSMTITEMEMTRVCPWPLHWPRLPGLPRVSVT